MFNMKRFCDLVNKLLSTSIGLLLGLKMTSLFQKKKLDQTEFLSVFPNVLVALSRNSSFMLVKPFWGKNIPDVFAESQSFSQRFLILMTLRKLIDHLMHYAR